ncbi:MAG: alkyl sulfatase dimerization domain-containing protein, partial [bacterium]
HSLREQYVSYKDVSKMILKRYTGWWNDMPSQWSPAPMPNQAAMIVDMAGGVDAVVAKSRQLLPQDVQMASHLAEWVWLVAPENPDVQQLVIDVYKDRILDPASNTQEILAYLDLMAEARALQLQGQ